MARKQIESAMGQGRGERAEDRKGIEMRKEEKREKENKRTRPNSY